MLLVLSPRCLVVVSQLKIYHTSYINEPSPHAFPLKFKCVSLLVVPRDTEITNHYRSRPSSPFPHPPLVSFSPSAFVSHTQLTIPRITKFLESFEVWLARPSSNFCSSREHIHCREGQRRSKLNVRIFNRLILCF